MASKISNLLTRRTIYSKATTTVIGIKALKKKEREERERRKQQSNHMKLMISNSPAVNYPPPSILIKKSVGTSIYHRQPLEPKYCPPTLLILLMMMVLNRRKILNSASSSAIILLKIHFPHLTFRSNKKNSNTLRPAY